MHGGDERRPRERFKIESQIRTSQKRRDVGHVCMRVPPQKDDVILASIEMLRQQTTHSLKELGGIPNKEARDPDPLVL